MRLPVVNSWKSCRKTNQLSTETTLRRDFPVGKSRAARRTDRGVSKRERVSRGSLLPRDENHPVRKLATWQPERMKNALPSATKKRSLLCLSRLMTNASVCLECCHELPGNSRTPSDKAIVPHLGVITSGVGPKILNRGPLAPTCEADLKLWLS